MAAPLPIPSGGKLSLDSKYKLLSGYEMPVLGYGVSLQNTRYSLLDVVYLS